MRLRAGLALLLCVSACATSAPGPGTFGAQDPRRANLQRAATLPWTDGGRCAVREAARPWPVLAERCYQDLDHDRVAFHDPTGRCAVASAGAVAVGLGLCVLAAPEVVAGAVIVTGVVVVGLALKEALDAYELRRGGSLLETHTVPEPRPVPLELSPNKRPKPEPEGAEFPPLEPPVLSEQERRRRCEPIPVPHKGENDNHNMCADGVPNNSFPGWDVFVNGKNFDALQLATRTLWEVKTDDFDKHNRRSQQFFIEMKLPEIQRERKLAEECGYNFVVGVRSAAHKAALKLADATLKVVVMDWC